MSVRLISKPRRIIYPSRRFSHSLADPSSPKWKYVPKSGTYPQGFSASGIHCGVKKDGKTLDLALLTSSIPATAAAVFTKNVFKAAPVVLSRQTLDARNGAGIRSIIVNSGCANAVTGKGGFEDATEMASTVDKLLGERDPSTIVMSTGVIGQRLPITKIISGIPTALRSAGSDHDSWMNAAKAICTTDTFPKLASRAFTLPGTKPGTEYRIAGMTKGAGMIHPNMATLLGFMATDAPVSPSALQQILQHAVGRSFNAISVDGDMSTNDTVALLANGAAGGTDAIQVGTPAFGDLVEIIAEFSEELAKLVVRDGEGATKFVTVRVVDALSFEDAKQVASTIARSPLVKTALFGRDANWGRILCATGYSGIDSIEPTRTNVSFVPTDGSAELKLLVNGEPENVNEARASEILEMEDLEIRVSLGTGGGQEAAYYTCDFSHE
ncbi:mitochondrial arginine biosynthesis bifunctional protein ArgJ [Drechslerella stenobrocha 248]|uniref:Arginine biosynthesis bifunctional protein ArgJ, mitochondrial n=1 Tax=Drechslerella stenobrocha 248 TaxID=1043628 RepID=W7HZH2_9PEZI|nr:mitochondrial arginine biosynthesis bifunctional protein ArgJ [Drechslerella stenobrocha 248]